MNLNARLVRYRKRLALSIFGVAAAGIAGGVFAASIAGSASRISPLAMPDAAASPPSTLWTAANVFRDTSTNNTFSVQLQAGRPDTGQFDYFSSGQGDYLGTANLSLAGGSGNVKVYENVADNATALFEPINGSAPTSVPIRLEGQVLNNGSDLVLNIWINGVQASFATKAPDLSQAATLAQQAVAAMSSRDWAAFYNLLAPQVQGQFQSQQAFSQSASIQNANVVSATLTGTATTSSGSGYSYFSQGVAITANSGSTTVGYSTTIYLVYENGQWFVLGNDPPA